MDRQCDDLALEEGHLLAGSLDARIEPDIRLEVADIKRIARQKRAHVIPLDDVPVERWVNNQKYKLYDTVGLGNGKFYEVDNDMYEKNAIPDNALTSEELQAKQYFQSILDTMHK